MGPRAQSPERRVRARGRRTVATFAVLVVI
jgi:hypothetical protein